MRFRPANIRLINRRSNLLRLLLALSSKNKNNNPAESQILTGSLHIRDGVYLQNERSEKAIPGASTECCLRNQAALTAMRSAVSVFAW
jgi:hypothetical protein